MRFVCVLGVCLLPSLAAAQSTTIQPVQVLHRFTASPGTPAGPLVQLPGGDFYGVTSAGILRMTPAGQVSEFPFFTDDVPVGALVLASDGGLYGTTTSRWAFGFGGRSGVFRFDPASRAVRTIHAFDSADARYPLGGLVVVGGSLYGVARSSPNDDGGGVIFHVVIATGQVVTDHVFGATALPRAPTSPLVLGLDGLLYGTTALGTTGTIYRFDPQTSAVTVVHQFTAAEARNPGALTLGADGSLYGSASAGGTSDSGTLFRYTPGTATFQVLYSFGSTAGDGGQPGPLVAGGDGHFYGVTSARYTAPSTSDWTVFRLRNAGGGTFTYERLRVLDGDAAGNPYRSGLTRGADGLLYGTAATGGPTLAGTDSQFVLGGPGGPPGPGTIFRFDPAETGPPSNTIAFTVVHAFPLVTTWSPSAPVLAADGSLYGLTSAGGSTNRGAAYRLNPTTGAVAILGELPGALTGRTTNTALAPGGDGLLYGITRTSSPSPVEQRIVRVTPATGTVTDATTNQLVPNELVPSPSGGLYGIGPVPVNGFLRFDPATSQTLVLSAYIFGFGSLPVTVTSDGQVYTLRQQSISGGARTSLMRLTDEPTYRYQEIVLADDIGAIDRLIEAPGGATYLAAGYLTGWAIVSVNRTTGAVARVCSIPGPSTARVESTSVGPDGGIYGFISYVSQRLFRCDPTTGAVTMTSLPPEIGRVAGPLVTVNGLLYGAGAGAPGSGGVLFRIAPGATLPSLDTDADGLPNTWETAYRLDAFSAGAGSGAADDPDGDGRTNAQELADGTHPRGTVTRLFAEGATGPFFRTRFDISVPTFAPAIVRARFLTDTGTVVAADLIVPAQSHIDFDPATLPGLAHASFSSVFESDVDIVVDRSMTWDGTGYGSHLETGIAAAATTWYLAEGSTSGPFALFYLLQNPQTTAVTATIRYLRPFGLPPIDRTYTLPPTSRTTIVVDDQGPELTSTDLSAVITSTSPIVVERAMYYSPPEQIFGAGHESAGVTAPALEWFLAEGATGAFFDLFVLIANPSPTAATVEVEYLQVGGGSLTKTYTVAGNSRFTIWVDDEQLPAGSGTKPFAATSVSMAVRSTNAVPIIVERAMWWPGSDFSSNYWYEAHTSPGVTRTATRWAMGGAEIGGVDWADTYVLIANTTATNGRARVSLVSDDYLAGVSTVDVPAKSRVTVSLRTIPGAIDGRYGVIVESLGPDTVPLVVERATYASPGGVTWAAGGNALASPLP
jgi:uncharacterized repeat protein (TIGR03803 family)